jgi:hypothetical protein
LPNDHPLPSDGEFNEDTSFGMRPILPGSGIEFAKGIGGNRPREQFTIVIVSFNREQVLAVIIDKNKFIKLVVYTLSLFRIHWNA